MESEELKSKNSWQPSALTTNRKIMNDEDPSNTNTHYNRKTYLEKIFPEQRFPLIIKFLREKLKIILPIAMVCVGAIYSEDCPASNFIPIYLLIGGFAGIIDLCLNHFEAHCELNENEERDDTTRTYLYYSFAFIWLVIGSITVYKIFIPNYNDPFHENYCHKVLYFFAFTIITTANVFIGLLALLLLLYFIIKLT